MQNAHDEPAKSSYYRKGLNSPKDHGGLRRRVCATHTLVTDFLESFWLRAENGDVGEFGFKPR
jgi:hypothetical protein